MLFQNANDTETTIHNEKFPLIVQRDNLISKVRTVAIHQLKNLCHSKYPFRGILV